MSTLQREDSFLLGMVNSQIDPLYDLPQTRPIFPVTDVTSPEYQATGGQAFQDAVTRDNTVVSAINTVARFADKHLYPEDEFTAEGTGRFYFETMQSKWESSPEYKNLGVSEVATAYLFSNPNASGQELQRFVDKEMITKRIDARRSQMNFLENLWYDSAGFMTDPTSYLAFAAKGVVAVAAAESAIAATQEGALHLMGEPRESPFANIVSAGLFAGGLTAASKVLQRGPRLQGDAALQAAVRELQDASNPLSVTPAANPLAHARSLGKFIEGAETTLTRTVDDNGVSKVVVRGITSDQDVTIRETADALEIVTIGPDGPTPLKTLPKTFTLNQNFDEVATLDVLVTSIYLGKQADVIIDESMARLANVIGRDLSTSSVLLNDPVTGKLFGVSGEGIGYVPKVVRGQESFWQRYYNARIHHNVINTRLQGIQDPVVRQGVAAALEIIRAKHPGRYKTIVSELTVKKGKAGKYRQLSSSSLDAIEELITIAVRNPDANTQGTWRVISSIFDRTEVVSKDLAALSSGNLAKADEGMQEALRSYAYLLRALELEDLSDDILRQVPISSTSTKLVEKELLAFNSLYAGVVSDLYRLVQTGKRSDILKYLDNLIKQYPIMEDYVGQMRHLLSIDDIDYAVELDNFVNMGLGVGFSKTQSVTLNRLHMWDNIAAFAKSSSDLSDAHKLALALDAADSNAVALNAGRRDTHLFGDVKKAAKEAYESADTWYGKVLSPIQTALTITGGGQYATLFGRLKAAKIMTPLGHRLLRALKSSSGLANASVSSNVLGKTISGAELQQLFLHKMADVKRDMERLFHASEYGYSPTARNRVRHFFTNSSISTKEIEPYFQFWEDAEILLRNPELMKKADIDPQLLKAVDLLREAYQDQAQNLVKYGLATQEAIDKFKVNGVSTYVYQDWDITALYQSSLTDKVLFNEFQQDLITDFIARGMTPEEAAVAGEAAAKSIRQLGENKALNTKMVDVDRPMTVGARHIDLHDPNKFTKYYIKDPEVKLQRFAGSWFGQYAINKSIMDAFGVTLDEYLTILRLREAGELADADLIRTPAVLSSEALSEYRVRRSNLQKRKAAAEDKDTFLESLTDDERAILDNVAEVDQNGKPYDPLQEIYAVLEEDLVANVVAKNPTNADAQEIASRQAGAVISDVRDLVHMILGVSNNDATSDTGYMLAKAGSSAGTAVYLGKLPIAMLTENANAVIAAGLGGSAQAKTALTHMVSALSEIKKNPTIWKRLQFVAEQGGGKPSRFVTGDDLQNVGTPSGVERRANNKAVTAANIAGSASNATYKISGAQATEHAQRTLFTISYEQGLASAIPRYLDLIEAIEVNKIDLDSLTDKQLRELLRSKGFSVNEFTRLRQDYTTTDLKLLSEYIVEIEGLKFFDMQAMKNVAAHQMEIGKTKEALDILDTQMKYEVNQTAAVNTANPRPGIGETLNIRGINNSGVMKFVSTFFGFWTTHMIKTLPAVLSLREAERATWMLNSLGWTFLGVLIRDAANGEIQDREYFDNLLTPQGMTSKLMEAVVRSGQLPGIYGDLALGIYFKGSFNTDNFPLGGTSAALSAPFDYVNATAYRPIRNLVTGQSSLDDLSAALRVQPGLNAWWAQGIINNAVESYKTDRLQ